MFKEPPSHPIPLNFREGRKLHSLCLQNSAAHSKPYANWPFDPQCEAQTYLKMDGHCNLNFTTASVLFALSNYNSVREDHCTLL